MTQDLPAPPLLPTLHLVVLHVGPPIPPILPMDPVDPTEAVWRPPTHTELPVDIPALTRAPQAVQSPGMENADTRSMTTFTPWRIITSKYLE